MSIFRPFLKDKNKLKYIRKNTIGNDKERYFDYTASGLAFKEIESRIYSVLKSYANTHSKEGYKAIVTQKYYNMARKNLAKSFEVGDEFAILPSGTGATGAIKKFQELLGLYIPPATKKRYNIKVDKNKLPLVIVSAYEHHSNEVSFREAFCELKRVRLDKHGAFDLKHFEKILSKNTHRQIICSIALASNVTGIISPYKQISALARKYKAIICYDMAASSPYMNIPSKYYDGLYASAHKLLGGVGSCGILILRKSLIDSSIAPSFSGGGTVLYVNDKRHSYINDIETREDAGTPAILQLIRASLAYQLRNEIGLSFIKRRKEKLKKIFINELKSIDGCVIYGDQDGDTLGIVSFNIGDIDPYLICDRLSVDGAFQTRAGCSCAGPYGHGLLGLKEVDINDKPGWLRVSLHFSHRKKDVLALANAIKNIAKDR